MDIQLQNIANKGRKIFLFCRKDNGAQEIIEDNTFFPYWFEPDEKGTFVGYDNTKLRKVFASNPSEISKLRSKQSYSSDILFTKRYIIDKVDKIDISPIKYLFLDIEIQATDLPDTHEAKYPISCITIYNSLYKKTQTWWLPDFPSEKVMLIDFVKYIQEERPDILLAWNMKFDYDYLFHRIKDFAKDISPIHQTRYGEEDGVFYPAGISIVDYLILFRKVYMREPSYALDNIAQKYLQEKTFQKVDYSKLDLNIKEKNINDIRRMVELEQKFELLSYYNEIRILSKCLWEDLYHNSRIMEMLLFEEAKQKNIVLPNKKTVENPESFQGATRDILRSGVFTNVGKLDLGSAYPSMMVNFCLDNQNLNTNKEGVNINGIYFNQNTNALLPSIVNKILQLKTVLKEQKTQSPNDKVIATKYDAIKGIVNSSFGTIGNEYFRIYNPLIVASITYLVRDVLMYVKDRLNQEGYEVIYWDTDAVMVTTKKDIAEKLNEFVQDWVRIKYNKDSIDLYFEYEGYFEKLFLLGKCHYVGYLRKGNDLQKEIKGVEIKRSSSTKFEAEFQNDLIDKILNNEKQEDIEKWIKRERMRLRQKPIEYIAFPCKINTTSYINEPIFVRALRNTKKIKSTFKLNVGERFYYIYVQPRGEIDVIGFTEEDKQFVEDFKIDWIKVEQRNIFSKVERIFECLNWQSSLDNQQKLF